MSAELHTLPNGIRVAIDPVPHVQTVAMDFRLMVGSRMENEKNNGISHFLEHAVFKGTKKRKTGQVAADMAAVGARIGAETGTEHTSYYCYGMAEDAGLFIDVLSDLVMNPTFPEDEIKRERDVILQEINGYKKSLEKYFMHFYMDTIFPGAAVSLPTLGPENNVANMTSDALRRYYKSHYHGGNLIVSVSGNVNPGHVLEELEKTVGQMKPGL